jgi:hypothetical protein
MSYCTRVCWIALVLVVVGLSVGCDTSNVPTNATEPPVLGGDEGRVSASSQTISFILEPTNCGPFCWGIDLPEGNTGVWSVRVYTSDGLPTSVSKNFRIYTSDFNTGNGVVQPVCTHGAGVANAGIDYTALDSTRTVPSGTANGTLYYYNVPTTNDALFESNERFVIQLETAGSWACAAIINND